MLLRFHCKPNQCPISQRLHNMEKFRKGGGGEYFMQVTSHADSVCSKQISPSVVPRGLNAELFWWSGMFANTLFHPSKSPYSPDSVVHTNAVNSVLSNPSHTYFNVN